METNSQTKLSKQRIPQYVENALINVNPSGCLDSRERRIKRREKPASKIELVKLPRSSPSGARVQKQPLVNGTRNERKYAEQGTRFYRLLITSRRFPRTALAPLLQTSRSRPRLALNPSKQILGARGARHSNDVFSRYVENFIPKVSNNLLYYSIFCDLEDLLI